MNRVKRVVLSIRRKKESKFLFCLYLCAITLLFIVLEIFNGSFWNLKEIEKTYGSSFSVENIRDESNPEFWENRTFDNGMTVNAYVGPRVTYDLMNEISQIPGIKGYDAGTSWQIFLPDYKLVPGSWNYGYEHPAEENAFTPAEIGDCRYLTNAYITHDSIYFEKFYDGSLLLKEGRTITPQDKDVAIVSDVFAQNNHIKIGDTIQLNASSLNIDTKLPVTSLGETEISVIGIFQPSYQQIISEQYTVEWDILDNWILVDINTGLKLAYMCGYDNYVDYNEVFVDTPSELDRIMDDVSNLENLDNRYFILKRDDTNYKSALVPLKSIRIIMAITLSVIIIICIALFYLTITHSVKKREREAGIMLALGISGREIRRQFILENILLGIGAYILAWLISSAAAPRLGDNLLHTLRQNEEQKIYSEEEIEAAIRCGDYDNLQQLTSNQKTVIVSPDTLNIHPNLLCALLVAVAEFLMILWGVMSALEQTLRWEPAQILSMIR